MATVWLHYGYSMATVWERHGKGMRKTVFKCKYTFFNPFRCRAVALRQPYRWYNEKRRNIRFSFLFADRTRLDYPLSPILCSRLYLFNYLANKWMPAKYAQLVKWTRCVWVSRMMPSYCFGAFFLGEKCTGDVSYFVQKANKSSNMNIFWNLP